MAGWDYGKCDVSINCKAEDKLWSIILVTPLFGETASENGLLLTVLSVQEGMALSLD